MASILKELGRQLFDEDDCSWYSDSSESSYTSDEESYYSVTDRYRKKKQIHKEPLPSRSSKQPQTALLKKNLKEAQKRKNNGNVRKESPKYCESNNTELRTSHSLQQTRSLNTKKGYLDSKTEVPAIKRGETIKEPTQTTSEEERKLSQSLKDFWDEVDLNVAGLNTSDILEGPKRFTDMNSYLEPNSPPRQSDIYKANKNLAKNIYNDSKSSSKLSVDMDADDADSLVYSINTSSSSVTEVKPEQMAKLMDNMKMKPLLKTDSLYQDEDQEEEEDDDTLSYYLANENSASNELDNVKKQTHKVALTVEKDCEESEETTEGEISNKENIDHSPKIFKSHEEDQENSDLIWAHPHDGSSVDVTLQDLVWIHPHDGSFEDVDIPKNDKDDNFTPLETIVELEKGNDKAKGIKRTLPNKNLKKNIEREKKPSSLQQNEYHHSLPNEENVQQSNLLPPRNHSEQHLQSSATSINMDSNTSTNETYTEKMKKTLDINSTAHLGIGSLQTKILAATQIQRWYRSLIHKAFLDSVSFNHFVDKIEEKAAIEIQRIARGKSCRHQILSEMGIAKRHRWEPRTKPPDITLLHSKMRRTARAFLRSRPYLQTSLIFAIRRICAIKIQTLVRRYLFRLHLHDHLNLYYGAAAIIQKSVRGYQTRKYILEMLKKEDIEKATTIVQSIGRTYIHRVRYLAYLKQIRVPDGKSNETIPSKSLVEGKCAYKPMDGGKNGKAIVNEYCSKSRSLVNLEKGMETLVKSKVAKIKKNPSKGLNGASKKTKKKPLEMKNVPSFEYAPGQLLDSSWDKFQDIRDDCSDVEHASTSLLSAFRRQRRRIASMLGLRKKSKKKKAETQTKSRSIESPNKKEEGNSNLKSKKKKVSSIFKRGFKSFKKKNKKEVSNASNEESLNLCNGEEMDKKLSSRILRVSKYNDFNDNESVSSDAHSVKSEESKQENIDPLYVELNDGDVQDNDNYFKEEHIEDISFPRMEVINSNITEFEFDPFNIWPNKESEHFNNKYVPSLSTANDLGESVTHEALTLKTSSIGEHAKSVDEKENIKSPNVKVEVLSPKLSPLILRAKVTEVTSNNVDDFERIESHQFQSTHMRIEEENEDYMKEECF